MKFVVFLILFISFSVVAQEKFVRKLEKVIGHELIAASSEYLTPADTSSVSRIWSRTLDSTCIGFRFGFEYIDTFGLMERESLCASYITSNCITKQDFMEFRSWLRDSIAREWLYYSIDNADLASRWIDYSDKYFSINDGKYMEFDPTDREINRLYFPLNWKQKLRYDDPRNVPHLADMYLPQPERFRKKHVFDYRKIYSSIPEKVDEFTYHSRFPVYIDEFGLARASISRFDELSVLSFLYSDVQLDAPVSFIEPFMASAYCTWKSTQLSKELGNKRYSVVCRLPNANELLGSNKSFRKTQKFPAYDYTEQWKITNAEFKEFSESVLDSLCRELLYQEIQDDELALTLLDYKNYYFSLGHLEFHKLNPKERDINREYFSWSEESVKWDKFGYKDVTDVQKELKLDSLPFSYEWMDCRNRGEQGTLYPEKPARPFRKDKWPLELRVEDIDIDWEPIGQDLRLDGCKFSTEDRHSYYGYGTRTHANLQRFIKRERVFIPMPQEIADNEEFADISYDQAIAYYNWKFRIDKYQEGEDWHQFVFPTREEFTRIKNGKSVIHPEQVIEFDEPVFRMVIEIIKD